MQGPSISERTLAALMYYLVTLSNLAGFVFFAFFLLERGSFVQRHAKRIFLIAATVFVWLMLSIFAVYVIDGTSFTHLSTQVYKAGKINTLFEYAGAVVSYGFSEEVGLSQIGKYVLMSNAFVMIGAIVYSFVSMIKAFLGKL